MPLPSATRFPFLVVLATFAILTAAAADAVIWTQGAERRQLVDEVQNAQVEAELLRFENDRLRRRVLEMQLAPRAAACETDRAAQVVPAEPATACHPNDPLCGL